MPEEVSQYEKADVKETTLCHTTKAHHAQNTNIFLSPVHIQHFYWGKSFYFLFVISTTRGSQETHMKAQVMLS